MCWQGFVDWNEAGCSQHLGSTLAVMDLLNAVAHIQPTHISKGEVTPFLGDRCNREPALLFCVQPKKISWDLCWKQRLGQIIISLLGFAFFAASVKAMCLRTETMLIFCTMWFLCPQRMPCVGSDSFNSPWWCCQAGGSMPDEPPKQYISFSTIRSLNMLNMNKIFWYFTWKN